MKKLLLGGLFLSFMAISCSKDGDDEDTTPAEDYLHTTAGSTWNYRTIDNTTPGTPEDYTRTSTNRDSTINGKTYHVYTNSNTGESEYNGKSNNDYIIYQALPDELGGSKVENTYLKAAAAVNTTWVQTYPLDVMGFSINAVLTNKIVAKGLTKTVNGIAYTNVIDVKTDVGITGVPAGFVTITTDIHQYYAPKFGLIQSDTKIDASILGDTQSTNTTTTLQSSNLL